MAIDRTKITRLAENHMAMGKVERAIDEFLKLIEDRPDDFQLLNRVGDAYVQAGKIPEAVDLFKRAGAGFERGGFNSKATAVFKKAHRIAVEDMEVAERLAELYRSTNLIKDAIQIHIEVADLFTRKGLIKRALEEFAKVVDLDPKNLKNKVKLADLCNKEGMKDRAANIYLEVAEALAMEQRHGEANQILERAKTMVSSPQVFLTQSRLCVIQKNLQAAADHLREGLAANPRSPELLDALAEVELQSKRPEQALEALAQVAQLPEKSLLLCERALHDLVRTGNTDEGLRLFKPIGREFSRRGMGEAAAKSLRAGLQGVFTVEAWIQLADMAHQGGNRAEHVECLRHAHAQALALNDAVLAGTLLAQLQALGVPQDELSAPFTPAAAGPQSPPPLTGADPNEIDPVLKMQIEQLERDGEHAVRNRFMDRALECYGKILDLDPANPGAIKKIADIHRASGVLSKVQMHYVRTAEKIAVLGFKAQATELLDKAEGLFPGSTRLYRRNLGLPGYLPPPPPAPPAAPPPVSPPPAAPAEAGFTIELQPIPAAPFQVEPPPPAPETSFQLPLELLEDLSSVPPPQATAPPALPVEYEWSEMAGEWSDPFMTLEVPPIPDLSPLPDAPPSQSLGAGRIEDDLASTLRDIDFQLDYGSPEEAKIEIESALMAFPNHPELNRRLGLAEEALRRLGMDASFLTLEGSDFTQSFFDLADVLGDALLETGDGEEMHDATHMVEKIQSVDELFDAFREGVEKQVKGDDYETHYNLGIAYKEMQLLEPAIEEFKKAMADPERTLECCSMLSICAQAQGDLASAARWLEQGIETPGFPPEDAIGLRYDLGTILELQGRRPEAQAQFRIVHDQNADYRDVSQLLN